MQLLLARLRAAFAWPDFGDWASTAGALALVAVFVLPVGFATRFLRAAPPRGLPRRSHQIALALAAFFAPALAEETVFRVLVLPGRAESAGAGAQAAWTIVSLAAFVLYHPAKAMLLPTHDGRVTTFRHPVFLLLAALLGAGCTFVYLRSGSIWPPAVLHWLVVVVWLLGLGGYDRLNAVPS